MKIGILSRRASLYSTRRLRQAAEGRGHRVRIVDPLRCFMNITAQRPAVIFAGHALEFDAVIPRIAPSITPYGLAVVRQFEAKGVYTVAASDGIAASRDKLRSLQVLAEEGIDMPTTGFARSSRDVDSVIDLIGGPPLIIKVLQGTHGRGVVLAETLKAARTVIAGFQQINASILVQEFIAEAAGRDIRALVVGDRVVAAMERRAPDGDFRSNLHRGGTAVPVSLTPEEHHVAVRAAGVMGLNVVGVDMLRSERGPLVVELNSSPGLEGIEGTTGVDVAGEIIELMGCHAGARGEGEASS